MSSYIYDSLIDNLKNGINEHYKSIIIKDASNIGGIYSYVDYDETETITTEVKITKLRDLNIDKLIDETCDMDKIDKEIEEIESKTINDDGFGEISVKVKQKTLKKYQIDLKIDSLDIMQTDFLFYSIIRLIDKEILKLIENVDVIDVNSLRELYNVEYKLMADKCRGGINRFGLSTYSPDKSFNLSKLDIGGPEKYIIMGKEKPMVLVITDIICSQNISPINFTDSYSIRVCGFLDMISKNDECKIVNLTDHFFNTLSS